MNSTPIGRIQCQTRAGAARWQPAEADGEDGDADDGDPEVRGRGADQRGEGDDPVEDAAGPEGRERADDDGGGRDQQHGDDREPERPDEGLQHHVDRGARLPQALAEVEVQHVPDVAAELHDQRVVQPVQLAELVDHLLRRVDRQEQRRRVAGQPRQEEDHDEEEHERDEARQNAGGVSGHGRPPGALRSKLATALHL